MKKHPFVGGERGVTLIEASIVLATVSLLTAVMAPSVVSYLDIARQARTREDIKTIADGINEFITDNGEHQFLRVANGGGGVPPTHDDGNRVDLLVSDGDIPLLSLVLQNLGDTLWSQAVNGADIDTLSNHLVENGPNDDNSTNRYRNPVDVSVGVPGGNNIDFARTDSSGFNAPYAWRGAYLRGPIDGDAWGNRYAVNVAFLDPIHFGSISGVSVGDPLEYPRMDVFVVSAGPDEELDTAFCQDGAVPGDDDFIFLVSSNAK